MHNERNKAEREHLYLWSFTSLRLQRGIFFPFLLFFKNSGTFGGKKIHLKKALTSVLFFPETKCKPAKKYREMFYYLIEKHMQKVRHF